MSEAKARPGALPPACTPEEHRVVIGRLGRGLARKLGIRVEHEALAGRGVLRSGTLELWFSPRGQHFCAAGELEAEAEALLGRIRTLLLPRGFRFLTRAELLEQAPEEAGAATQTLGVALFGALPPTGDH